MTILQLSHLFEFCNVGEDAQLHWCARRRIKVREVKIYGCHQNGKCDIFCIVMKSGLLWLFCFQAQYAMLIDIAHNVVLYTEPKKKV